MRPLALLALLAAPAAGIAQQPAPRPDASAAPRLDATTRRSVIDSVSAALVRGYVDADTGRRIADHLRRRFRDGAYNALSEPTLFAQAVTADLKAVNGDEHLFLNWTGGAPVPGQPPRGMGPGMAPGGPAMPGGGPVMVMVPQGGGPLPASPGAASPQPGGGPMPVMIQAPANMERLINNGLRKVEILPGNIGYLLVDEFAGSESMATAIAGALRFLEHSDAIIVDVRNNRGGQGEMSHMLFSHFLAAKPVPTIRVRDRLRGTDEILDSDSIVPGPRRTDVPLYVLTSRATVSAAEEFAFVLRRLGRATLVGERTLGAGHMNAISDIGNGFKVSVSFARVSDPVTGAEWERVGVQPTVEAPPAKALDVAHALALRTVAQRSDDPIRAGQLRALATIADARVENRVASAAALANAPGRYTDGRLVEAVGGTLWYTGLNGIRTELLALADDWFALGDQKARFDGQRMSVQRPDGSTYAFDRQR